MNTRSLNILEYPKILHRLASFCVTDEGKNKALTLSPMNQYDDIEKALDETEEAVNMSLRNGKPPLVRTSGIEDILHKAEIGSVLDMGSLLEVASLLRLSKDLIGYFDQDIGKSELQRLLPFFEALDDCHDLEKEISKKILGPNEMADHASLKLANLRQEIIEKNNQISHKLNRIVTSSAYESILQDRLVTIRDNRYVIPVKQEYRNRIPGIILDKSSTGSTVFIEPLSIVNLNNDLKLLRGEEEKEIFKILEDLTAKVAAYHAVISRDCNMISKLDFIFAKASYALSNGYVRVKIDPQGSISFINAKHPLLDPKKAVASDIVFRKNIQVIVITGPNTGGKTVTLKTIGLLTLMIQSGLFVPVREGSTTGLFKDVFADIGDEQSIEQSLSTFSAHMHNIVYFMQQAKRGDLVLFDELGAGTDPTEGAALAIAILNELHRRHVITVATTHYSELKEYALTTPGITNASVEFDVKTLRPTYRLVIGIPGKSNAFEIANRLGLSDDIISQAKHYIDSDSSKFSETLDLIDQKRKEMEATLAEAQRKEREAEQKVEAAEKKVNDIYKQRDKILQEAHQDAANFVQKTKDESEEIYHEIRAIQENTQASIDNKKLEALRKEINHQAQLSQKQIQKDRQKKYKKKAVLPKKIAPGDVVLVESLNKEGEILEINQHEKKALVQIGPMKIQVKLSQLSQIQHFHIKKKPAAKKIKASDLHKMNNTLDIRGMTGDEARYAVEKFLSDAVVSKTNHLVIIHGKGTGVLQKVVREYLKHSSVVQSFRYGNPSEGGTGATFVNLA
ncbi:endonuclease MutS2 [Pseudoramibacter sp.]|jgi:DNA mismatch repair protein MutS2|uniref:endonuclease MutS2 n=1 Tax=Pseudoramibacter sp. TaxID=2034862 RepID=UPI0025EC67EA|nr:endonuclease MutS2 [Pseudoramibacter sp.]MCH4072940.1 endonuclease MutS2 [Pseudoramibacter sp.]MCH4106711.1 endonuclease MutS2 [Pseudoramibacter sp.]